jgi:hypothetical protein
MRSRGAFVAAVDPLQSRISGYPRRMSRRADPTRIDDARHAAIRNSLIGDGVTEATADAWNAARSASLVRTATARRESTTGRRGVADGWRCAVEPFVDYGLSKT